MHIILFILLFSFTQISCAKTINTKELHLYADGLNIEGGRIPRDELKGNKIWANLAIVLDRPIITGETLDVLTKKNKFKLKEASILSYDESKANTAYISILNYYIKYGRNIVKKPNYKPVEISVNIHRNSSAYNHYLLIKSLLFSVFNKNELHTLNPENKELGVMLYKPTNTIIRFKKGFIGDALKQDPNSDIIISLSMVSGLNPRYDSGELLLPNTFIPFDVQDNKLHSDQFYTVENDLIKSIPHIIHEQNQIMLHKIKDIKSENLEKNHITKRLKISDFHKATILQANEYFYPK